MVRLVKGAYWDSEIKRAQVDGLAGYPVFTRKVHTDVSYLACARKLLARAGRGLPAVRHPQRAHAGRDLSAWPAPTVTPASTSSSACTAWARRCTRRSSARDKLDRAVPHLRAGRHARDLLAYLVRRLLENGANTSFVNRIADPSVSDRRAGRRPGRRSRARSSRSARRIRDRRCRATCTAPSARNSRGHRPRRTSTRSPRSPQALHASAADALARRPLLGAAAATGDGAPVAAIPPTTATSSAPCARPTRRRGRRALAHAPRPRAGLGRDAGRPSAPRASSAPPTCSKRACRALIGLLVREAGKILRQRRRRGARGGRFPALLRAPQVARDFANDTHRAARARSSASARGTSRWRSSPARSPRRWPPATPCSPSRPSRRR